MYDSARDTVKEADGQGDALGKITCPWPNQQEVTPMPCSKEEFERKFYNGVMNSIEHDQGEALGKITCPNPNQQEVTPMPCSKEEFERKFYNFHNDVMSRWAVKHGVRWQLDPTP
jgi:hypothetical protein